MDIELIQFPFSHYNEKARWALDYKGIPHRRTNLLPGPHRGHVKKLTGHTTTPVLRIGRSFVSGSARIIERLEREFPDAPALYPADEDQRAQALELERHFDLVFGPATRILFFAATIKHPSYIPRMFSTSKPWPVRAMYRAMFPLTRGLMAKANGLQAHDALQHATRHVSENMDTLERHARRGPYLVGESFTVADLCAAALMAPLLDPPHPDMQLPEGKPRALLDLNATWRAHAAGQWALGIYAKHR